MRLARHGFPFRRGKSLRQPLTLQSGRWRIKNVVLDPVFAFLDYEAQPAGDPVRTREGPEGPGLLWGRDTIRIRAKVLAKEERSRGKRGVVTWNRQIVNQHGKAVEEGIIITLVEGKARRPARVEDGNKEPEKTQ